MTPAERAAALSARIHREMRKVAVTTIGFWRRAARNRDGEPRGGAMRERPILFSAPMVRAILAGTKTQTRRPYKPRHREPYEGVTDGAPWRCDEYGDYHPVECPYGAPGDRLWVKETWCSGDKWASLNGGDADSDPPQTIRYRADNTARTFRSPTAGDWFTPDMYAWSCPEKWKPSIFMSRWMSRITLEIVAVRFERLQAIREDGAAAEGVASGKDYIALWDSINGVGSWLENPWVWVIEFRRLP